MSIYAECLAVGDIVALRTDSYQRGRVVHTLFPLWRREAAGYRRTRELPERVLAHPSRRRLR
jgi:hypothetical protein